MRIEVTFVAKWQIKRFEYYKFTTCKKLINTKTGKLIAMVSHHNVAGYYIKRKFIRLDDLRGMLELIPAKSSCPF